MLEENNIPLTANPVIVSEYRQRGDRFSEEEDLEGALEMYTLAYILDDSLENQMRYKFVEAALNGGGSVDISL